MKNKFKYGTLGLVVSAFLFGCGGGGSSSTPPPPGDDTQTVISGSAVDGYLKSSTVVLDLDGDGYLTAGEPVTATDENGSYTLPITQTHRDNAGYKTAQLIIYDGKDSDTGNRYLGKLKSPNDGTANINITPMTTQLAAVVKSSINSNFTEEEIKAKIVEAKIKVKKALKIPDNIDIGADPIKLAKNNSSET